MFHYQDILEAKHFKPCADTFFSILTYNPDARRLANTQGEIRVGASHQAIMPECQSLIDSVSGQWNQEMIDQIDVDKWETPTWKCQTITDANLLTYLTSARSISAYAGFCDRDNMDDCQEVAGSDDITIYALNKLHEMNYDTSKALQSLVKNPIPKMFEDKKWNDEDQVIFVLFNKYYTLF